MNGKDEETKYTAADQMVVAGAHQIRPDDVIYVGLGLPFLSVLLAKYTHAPESIIIIENGIVRSTGFDMPRATDTLGSQFMSDQLSGLFHINCLGQGGHISTGFIGAGQVDRYGNVNDTCVGDYRKPVHRWSGSGGARRYQLLPALYYNAPPEQAPLPGKSRFYYLPGLSRWQTGVERESGYFARHRPSHGDNRFSLLHL